MTDFASIGIEMDSRPVIAGTKALDALGEASARVDQKISTTNGRLSDAAKIMQAQAEQAKAAAQANAVLGNSTSALTIGQVQLIEKFREQAATVGMSRSQLMAYQAAQLGVTEQTKEAVAAVKAHEDALKAASQAKADAAKSANVLTDAIKLLGAAYAALKIGEFVKDSAMQAARFETLGIVMGVVGKNAGYTALQMDVAAQSIAAQGITMLESRNSAIKLVQAHVDLTNASKLARIAQDAAVIGNINSSEAFDRLVNGVARGNVLILRNLGINVNLQAAYQQMADSLGKTSKELTENERVQARLNAVMERGSDIAGTYEASMGTAGKQILSMQRYVSDLKTVFGEVFTEVLTVAVMGLTQGLKDANGEVSELSKNNQLQEWGHGIAKVFIGIADVVGNAITYIQKFDAFARHMDARTSIGRKYDSQVADTFFTTDALAHPVDAYNKGKRIDASRQTELAEENVRYEQEQKDLTGNFNRFDKQYDDFYAGRKARQKADADARLKIDQDYAAAASAILMKSAGGSAGQQEAARKQVVDLYNKTYIGTPDFRDTEGRDPKPKVDQADNARLQNHLARIQEESAVDKEYAEYQMRLDDMRHKADELGDEQYFLSRKENLATIYISEQAMYDKELAALRAHHSSTDAEREKNQKAIDDILGKQSAAQTKYSHDTFVADEAERLRQKAVEMASQDATNKYISGLTSEAEKLEQANGAHEKSRSAIEREAVARLDAAIALQQQVMAQEGASGASEKEVEQGKLVLKFLQDMRDARARIATAAATQESDLFSKKAADQAIQDWQRAGASISDSLSKAFGNGGKAIGEMFKAYSEGVAGQLRAQKDLAAAKKLSDDNPEKIAAISRAQSDGAQAQLKSYGDMAGAAQSYFEKGSAGYQAMGAAAKVMHAAEVALSIVKGVNAVLTQGEGDPYSAFARMAAMTALVAGLGVALTGGGGGGGMSAADRQKAQGAGSVLGDSSAKSDSIAHAISLTAANSSTQINYLSGMLASLQAIQTNIGSFASQLVQNTNISNPDVHLNTSNGLGKTLASWAAGGVVLGSLLAKIPVLGNLFDKVGTAIFGGKQSVSDSGFTLDKTSLASVLSGGVNAKTYADITTSGGWFSSDKHDTQSTALSADADKQFALVISSLADSIKQAGGLLGQSGDDFTAKLNSFVIDIGKVSLKGMTGDEQQKALESVFSKLGDQMAQWAVDGLGQFAKVGEGYLETLTRVATDYAKLDASLASVGMKFGSVGIASVGARENLVALAGGIDKFQSDTASFAQDFLSKAEQLAPVAKYVDDQLAALGLSFIKSRDQFKDEVLGLDLTTAAGQKEYAALMSLQAAFAATHAATVDLSKTEQEIADERKTWQDQLNQLTMTSAQLREIERASIDKSNLALYDQVQAIKDQQAATEAATKAATDAATALQAAQQAIRDGASAALGGVDSAFSVLQNVVNREKTAIQASVDAHSAAVSKLQSLSQALHSTLDGMKSPDQQVLERASAQAQIRAALAIARAGGPLPEADSLKNALSAVSKDASSQFGSYQDYLRDLYQTQNDISKLGDVTDTQLSVEQKALAAAQDQLKSLDKMLASAQSQVDILKGVDTNGLTLIQAMSGLTKAILAAQDNPIVNATSAITGAYQQYLGRAPDAPGLQWWQNAAASGAPVSQIVDGISHSTEADLNRLYQQYLGRAPDPEGLKFWMNAYGPTMDEAETADWIKDAQKAPDFRLPSFDVGIDHVPHDMVAQIHKGERVMPAADNRLLMARLSSPSSNSDALAGEIKALREENRQMRKMMESHLYAIAKNTRNSSDTLEGAARGQRPLQTQAATS